MASISVYVHFPWCLQKCPYCDFASGAIRHDEVPHGAYADAVLHELALRRPGLEGATLASVFFGGGTPSLWAPTELGRVLAAIRGAFVDEAPALEVSVECNPTSVDAERARALSEVGVSRLSLGVQSVRDPQLRFLGRLHDAAGALSALSAACSVVPRVSADVMFGVPDQDAGDLCDQLDTLVATGIEHVSAYALTVEPDTQFGALQRKGKLTLAPEEAFARCYLDAEAHLEALGFEHYEVSNYARPGARSVHNLHYWQGGAYLGLGAGAVGCLHGAAGRARRYRNEPRPEAYLAARALPALEVFEEALGPQELIREQLMLGLRTREGVDLSRAAERAGMDPLEGRQKALARQSALGNVVHEGSRLRVPQTRWLHLDGIVAELF